MMNAPKYIQVDTSLFGDNKVSLLLRKHGSAGLGVLVYYWVEIGRQSNYPNMQIDVSGVFNEAAACVLGIDQDVFDEITNDILRIGLLLVDGNGFLYSTGFNNRTGKDLLANHKRSVALSGKQKDTGVEQKPETKSINPMKRLPAPEIIECWNANAKSLRCMKSTNAIEKAIAKLCKEYALDEIQQSIENYHSVLNDPACFFSYKWNLGEFLSRANGFPVFAGDRDEIVSKYRKSSAKNGNPEHPKTRKELLETYK